MATKRRPPLWRCPECGRAFANRNQSHACGNYTLASHFDDKPKTVRAIFDKLLAVARRNGPVTVLPEKTRIAFQVRMSFAAFVIRRNWVDGHVVLARRLENPRFRRIETFSPRNHLHAFRFESVDEIDDEAAAWFTEAYQVGQQRHLG
ncbi:MAG TPA: DUF5655 domain-containing protein [Chthoniobacterales bacterium]|nr:DUF5655 domain-containing protein [Chthoniobacterales bacterium]